jgi:hypothetical protein
MTVTSLDPLDLHRGLRELVALSTLPAVWRSTSTAQIPESLADVLLRSLGAEFVFFRLYGRTDGNGIEGLRVHREVGVEGRTHTARAALSAYLTLQDDAFPAVAPNPLRDDGRVRLAVQRIGTDGAIGVLLVGSERPEFPSEMDRVLLEVGANQAAMILQQRWEEEALKQSEQRQGVALAAAEYVAHRKDDLLATLSDKLRWTSAIVDGHRGSRRTHRTDQRPNGAALWLFA